ncbi:beta-1,3(4)-glucanase precursor [Saccharobesus litoralis]|uniref:Beta-1,3(4)-glucanase n=1 Tax=Saccharobesus litoralis TaxID=2172099 RepID=A0A2S0VN75_9ALTE|nr:right-handed parallel beta-helix repeat-containing protein [Saccharobesus litoralis]AWB65665.1 beta-1,3(4)-glucanase precursor [Saccharobesus litoralis]
MHYSTSNKVIASVILLSLAPLTYAKEIYVSKSGNDSNSGEQSSPYLTLNKAANEAVAGDTVFIGSGTYEETLRPANSGSQDNPIIFTAVDGEKVIITAMQALNGWQKDSGDIYKTTVDWDLGQQNFVMQGATAMDLARWPNNTDGDPFTQNSLRNSGGSQPETINDAYLDYNQGIPDIDWKNGGSLYFYGDKPGSGWTTWRAFITDSSATRVYFDLDKNPAWIRTFHAPGDKGDFFLQGVKGALDYQNEWYFDPNSKELFVQLPNGAKPNDGQVKMRKRVKAIDLAGRNHIHIKNLAVFGGSIELTGGASNNLIYGVTSLYGNYTLGVVRGFNSGNQSIKVAGANNIIERSEIGFGSGSGIYDSGTNTQILDNYLHDFNYLGDYDSIINARGGNGTIAKYNTITRGGRDAIQTVNNNAEYAYNDVSFSNLIADDCGLLYTLGGPRNMTIHHNWFHDAYSSGTKKKATGIYLDNDTSDVDVHHNVVWNTEWSNIQINWDGTDLNIFNNTFINGEKVMGAWHKEGTQFSNVKVWNNLSDDSNWEPQSDKQNNLSYPANNSPFIDAANGDFRLKAGSSPVDAGRAITGFTDDVTDNKPDVGAYELGGNMANWQAGITWERKFGPTGLGCYGLPGEDCQDPITQDPDVSLSPTQTVDEGKAVSVTIELSTLAMTYPVTIPYTLSGTANADDHTLSAGDIVITQGQSANLAFEIKTDTKVENNETLIITLGQATNANTTGNVTHTITIKDKTPVPEPTPEPQPDDKAGNTESSAGGSLSAIFLLMLGWLYCRRLQRFVQDT